MKTALILNPEAGGSRGNRQIEEMREVIEHRLGAVDIQATERVGHAIELAKKCADLGVQRLLVVGGDGTLNEVVNGVMASKHPEIAVGIIPRGTGGDFRKSLPFEHRLDKYIDVISAGRTRAIDVGEIRYGDDQTRYFVNVLSCGMGGLVDQYIEHAKRRLGSGTLAYFSAALAALVTTPVGHLRIDYEDESGRHSLDRKSLMLAICNGQYFGGGMRVAPRAKLDDGMFECINLWSPTRTGLLLNGIHIYRGDHLDRPGTLSFRAKSLSIALENTDAKSKFLLDVDGESVGRLPIEVTNVPRALHLLVPEAAA